MGIVDKARQLAGQAQDKVQELRADDPQDAPQPSDVPRPHGDPLFPETPVPLDNADPAPSDPPRPHGDPADGLPGREAGG
jgi:hypothetical protein